ncbi:cbb3-type cytochrome oxidase assembly protein CcoS [Blattabacterium cuenoti]|nr:cbb3-type cytochrome oxidase assembly protein CcoS [Blattabacterium cuenoti]
MDIIIIMIISSISLGSIFLVLFIIGIYNGQFNDYESPKIRILIDDDIE